MRVPGCGCQQKNANTRREGNRSRFPFAADVSVPYFTVALQPVWGAGGIETGLSEARSSPDSAAPTSAVTP